MDERRYSTAFTMAKIVEIISWLILIGGVIEGLVIAGTVQPPFLGILFSLISLVFGLMLVFSAQLTLIFIDTENNTRKAVTEILKTNAMLSETLGTISANINKIANAGGIKK